MTVTATVRPVRAVLLLFVLMSICAAMPSMAIGAFPDAFEPNDDVTSAKVMPFGSYSSVKVEGAIQPASDVDVFRVDAPQADMVFGVALTAIGIAPCSGCALKMEVTDAQGTPMTVDQDNTAAAFKLFDAPGGGQQYLKAGATLRGPGPYYVRLSGNGVIVYWLQGPGLSAATVGQPAPAAPTVPVATTEPTTTGPSAACTRAKAAVPRTRAVLMRNKAALKRAKTKTARTRAQRRVNSSRGAYAQALRNARLRCK